MEGSPEERSGGWITCRVFADEVVPRLTVVVVPLEHVQSTHARGRGRLVIHHHTHLVATGGLIRVPVPAQQAVIIIVNTNNFIIIVGKTYCM